MHHRFAADDWTFVCHDGRQSCQVQGRSSDYQKTKAGCSEKMASFQKRLAVTNLQMVVDSEKNRISKELPACLQLVSYCLVSSLHRICDYLRLALIDEGDV